MREVAEALRLDRAGSAQARGDRPDHQGADGGAQRDRAATIAVVGSAPR